MAQEIERAFPSTPTSWEWVKIERRPRPDNAAGRKADLLRRLARRSMRRPLTMELRFRGGPECWWEIKARGRTFRVTGATAIHDVLTWINAEGWRED